jgi:hypothetical protein
VGASIFCGLEKEGETADLTDQNGFSWLHFDHFDF